MEQDLYTNPLPYIYQIEITERCNLLCPACKRTGEIEVGEDISLDIVQRIVDNNWLFNTPYTELQMSGEPLLHPDIKEIIKLIKSTNTMVGLSTNLITYSPENQLELFDMLDCVTISADTWDPELYEKSRFPAKYSKFRKNLDLLVENAPEKTHFYVQLLETEFTESGHSESLEKALAWEKEINKPNIKVRWVYDCFIEQTDRGHVDHTKFTSPGMGAGLCLNPFISTSIKADGTIVPCCFDFLKEIPLGNIMTDDLYEVWNGPRYEALRHQHQTNECLPKMCQDCYLKSPIKMMQQFATELVKSKL